MILKLEDFYWNDDFVEKFLKDFLEENLKNNIFDIEQNVGYH
jgi:hypothetical protein